ncbi:FeoA family protein [Saccharibacillus qingshengii]|uniref:FeoA family protein n=1 Tax=Saccharibacillus qingshengii TaxID=1763540 RepID=UPI001552ED50|nr:FeoA family protein [Saccharibacillus qingshengii]
MYQRKISNSRCSALVHIKPGAFATVQALDAISPLLRRRLRDLGVAEGSRLKVLRLGPFGGPLTFECAGQHIGIRREDAGRMEVAPA